MLSLSYDYSSCVRGSEKAAWRIDDVMPDGTKLDFGRPFLPAALAGRDDLEFLSEAETRTLNQITGNAYLNLFAFVEEYIIALAVQLAHAEIFGDHAAIRALSRFADEEAKHQQLFLRYIAAFKRDFGHECEVLGNASAVAGVILAKAPMAVLMVTLHLEIMTQAHYTECVRDDKGVDPFFAKLLHHHWLEESQHARIDALELDKLLSVAEPAQIEAAFQDYLDILAAFDGLLGQQADMDLRSFQKATGRTLDEAQSKRLVRSQHQGYRHTFLIYGMRNPTFAETIAKISPQAASRVKERAASLAQ